MRLFIGQGNGKEKVAFDRLNQLALKAMGDIALDNYHPLSRYQATVVISDLYEFGSQTTPLEAALPVLMKCLDSIDVVQIPALKGVLRHVKNGNLDDPQKQAVLAAMIKIASQKTPPEGRTPDGHDWIRRQAIEVLSRRFALPAAKGEVLALLTGILNDNQTSPRLRPPPGLWGTSSSWRRSDQPVGRGL